MQAKYIVGIVIIVGFMVFAAMKFTQSLTPYVSLEEAKAKGTTVQVKGVRVAGSEAYDAETKTFNFKLMDPNGQQIQVVYDGVKPSNFERAKEVVVIGRYRNGIFQAEDILVKCPSKYEAEGVEGAKS
ncbi:MAG: cytochrome c maturation protein CcmE [Calditrichaeota bacterium]|nr:MAG: cytochrome c maturation protein CcmE [Calditrichota bacterium]